MNLDEMIAVMQGAKEGKRIECQKRHPHSTEPPGWAAVLYPVWNWEITRYRLAPEPKKRLIRVEELPSPMWITNNEKDPLVSLVCGVAKDGSRLFLSNEFRFTLEEAAKKGWLWSNSHSGPWKSFEVEE